MKKRKISITGKKINLKTKRSLNIKSIRNIEYLKVEYFVYKCHLHM